MLYENELRFLSDTLKKCHIKTALVSPNEPALAVFGDEAAFPFINEEFKDETVGSFFGKIRTQIHCRLGKVWRIHSKLVIIKASGQIAKNDPVFSL